MKELGSLKDMRLKTSKAYEIKLSLRDFWDIRDPVLAQLYLKKWYFLLIVIIIDDMQYSVTSFETKLFRE
jgi:hypothetical protein